jgi:hypothetical protein
MEDPVWRWLEVVLLVRMWQSSIRGTGSCHGNDVGDMPRAIVGDMAKSPSLQYSLKAQEDIDSRGIRVTNALMR